MGESSQQLFIAGEGLLSHAGYNVQKNGPSRKQRQDLLFDIFNGVVTLPDTLSQSVVEQWGDPNSLERLKKIRNTINTSLGMQKGRSNTSPQAVKKWEEDLHFIDNDLIKNLENSISCFNQMIIYLYYSSSFAAASNKLVKPSAAFIRGEMDSALPAERGEMNPDPKVACCLRNIGGAGEPPS